MAAIVLAIACLAPSIAFAQQAVYCTTGEMRWTYNFDCNATAGADIRVYAETVEGLVGFRFKYASETCITSSAINGTAVGNYIVAGNGTTVFEGTSTYAGTCTIGSALTPKPAAETQSVADKNLGGGNCTAGTPEIKCGNPINTATGNKFQVEADFAGSDLLQFVRYYNSAPSAPTHLLGSHWTNTYTRRIESLAATPSIAVVFRPDGSGTTFNLISGVWRADADVVATLQRSLGSSGEFVGWTYTGRDSRQVEDFDTRGRLIGITRVGGQSAALLYNNGITENNADDFLPSSVTAQDGRRLLLTYDTSRRLSQLTDPGGAVYAYAYDASSRLQSVTYVTQGGTGKTYLYNESTYTAGANLPMALTGIVDEKGQRFAIFSYAADGRAVSTEHAGGVEKFSMVYNVDGTTAITSPDGAVEQRVFVAPNGVKKISAISETGGGVTRTSSYTYDSNGRSDVVTDAIGTATDYDFDARGLLTQKTESANQAATRRKIQTDWNATFSVPNESRVLNSANVVEAKSSLTYNSRGQVSAATQVNLVNALLSRTTTISYCESADVTAGICPLVGLVTSVNGPRTDVADVSTYSYYLADEASCASAPVACPYRKGDLRKITNAAGQIAEYLRHDGAGRPLSVRDPNGVVTDLEYSSRGWLMASKVRGSNDASETDDAITRLEYDLTGAVTKVTQPDGAFALFFYDAAHRLTDIGDALGNSTHYVLNNAGERIKEDTKDGSATLKRTLSRVYDTLGQLKTSADAFSTPTDLTYDLNGVVNTVTDAQGRITDSDVDSLGRLIRQIANTAGSASDKATTQMQYDARDNTTVVIDPKGLSTTYGYDSLDNLTQLVSPDSGTTTYSYDLAGNRTSQLDARGKTTGYTYDALNRLTVQSVPTLAQKVFFDYDLPQADCLAGQTFGAGRLARIRDESGSTRFCYDRFGHQVRKVQTVTEGTTLAVGTTYNAADRVVAMTYPSGAIVSFLRNANGQITRIDANPSAGAAQVTLVSAAVYLPFGPLNTVTYGNGRTLTKSYDQNYGIDSVVDSSAAGISQDFGLNAGGNPNSLTERTGASTSVSRSYTFDGLDRLTAQKNGASTVEGFAYDATGNRTSKTAGTTTAYSYAAGSHRLTSVGNANRTYDANGNTSAIGTGPAAKSFTFNDRNRLKEVRAGTVVKATYLYGGSGQRVAKIVPRAGPNGRQYVYDEAGHLLGEYTIAGVRVAEYVWLDDTLVAVLSSFDASTYQYVETDHLGTPRAVVHPVKNAIVWRWDVNNSAFGEHLPNGNPDGDALTYELSLRFPGQYYDAESGLHYNYFRDYDPATGRYIESDPIGLAGGPSTYAYAGGSPGATNDPSGLMSSIQAACTYDAELCAIIGGEYAHARATIAKKLCRFDEADYWNAAAGLIDVGGDIALKAQVVVGVAVVGAIVVGRLAKTPPPASVLQNNQVGNSFDEYVGATKLRGLHERGQLGRQEQLPTPDIAGKNYVQPDFTLYRQDGTVAAYADAKTGSSIPFDAQARGLIEWSTTTKSMTLIYYTPLGTTPISVHLLSYARARGVLIRQVGVR